MDHQSKPTYCNRRGELHEQYGRACIRDSNHIDLKSSASSLPSIPKPAQDLPLSCCSINNQDSWSPCKTLHPRVAFSERSSMYLYHLDPLYAQNKSYTKEDKKIFTTEMLSEAIRIKRLVLSTPEASIKDSFTYLLKNNIISPEEILGIEHLIFAKPSKLLQKRRDYARAVLMEQYRQRQVESEIRGDHTKKLGDFSSSRTAKSVIRARVRAAMAA